MATNKIQTGLRLEENMYWKLRYIAEQENRTLNNLVEYACRQFLADWEHNHSPISLSQVEKLQDRQK